MKIINKLSFRYFLVGCVNTIFGYSVFALFTWLGLFYPIALLLANMAGICFNFMTFGKFVFANTKLRVLWRFIAVYSLLYIINVSTVFVLMYYFDNLYLANALALIFVVLLGFVLNRRFVYANR
jgi:putative flippase GtrA